MEKNNSEKKYISMNFLSNGEDVSNRDSVNLKPSLGKINFNLLYWLVTFPLNHPKLDTLNDDKTNWILGENKDKKRREEKILLGETERMLYDGKSKSQINSNHLSE